MSTDPLVRDVVEVLAAGVDASELRKRLDRHFARAAPSPAPARGEMSEAANKLQSRIGLADILDDSILQAGRGDQAFPLRLFFGELVAECADDDVAFALASGLNLYFRVTMPEEPKVQLAVEVSRLYYRFAAQSLEPELRAQLSPLLAKLMSTELEKIGLESVDHVKMFDSAIHERDDEANASGAVVSAPRTFLCRVVSTGRPRFKAVVLT